MSVTSYTGEKPQLGFWQIFNMCFGFFGIQFGWSLQMGNMSAIYEYLGIARADSRTMVSSTHDGLDYSAHYWLFERSYLA